VALCHCEHYLTHLTSHKAIELVKLSNNDKKDQVSQMSTSESSVLAEPCPVCVCVCVSVCKISGSYSMLVCILIQT